MEEGEQIRPFGYWDDDNNLATEVRTAAERLGHFPTGSDLRRLGIRVAENMIYKKHGGMNAYREELGYVKPTREQHTHSIKRLIKHAQGLAPMIQQMEVTAYTSIDSFAEPSGLGYSQFSRLETYEGGNREDD